MGFPGFVLFVLLGTLQNVIGAPRSNHPLVKLAYDGHQDRPDENSLVRVASNLIPLALLPEHLTTSLLVAHEANIIPAAIRNLARAFFNNTQAMSECCHPTMNLKDMHLCLLRLSGMNPAYLRTFKCMNDYDKWMDWLPTGRYKEESSLKLWRMKSFKENLHLFGNKALKERFSECEGIVAMTSVSTIFETVYAQNANENLVQVFREYHKLLRRVIIPEHYEGVPVLGQLVYIILRHFSRSNYLQKVLDAMSKASHIWELFPVAVLRSILQQEAQRWTPESQSIFEDDLEPETSEPDFPVWWTETLYPFWWHESFLTRANLLLGIASVEYIPEDTAALNLIYSPKHPLVMPTFPKLIEWIVAIRIKDVASTIIELDNSFRAENFKILWDWRSQKPALSTTLPRLKCFTSIFPKKALIFPPEYLDTKMLAYYLGENKSFPLETIVVLLHHDKFEIFDMILRELYQADHFIPLNVILEKIWATKLSLGCKFSSLARDLKKMLGVTEIITVNGPLRDLRSEVANVMVAKIHRLGGQDFAELRPPNMDAFPTCISFLDLITSLFKTSVSLALWLYAHAQNFEGPNVRFEAVTSFKMLRGYHFECFERRSPSDAERALVEALLNHPGVTEASVEFISTLTLEQVKQMISRKNDPCYILEQYLNSNRVFPPAIRLPVFKAAAEKLGLEFSDYYFVNNVMRHPFSSLLNVLHDPSPFIDELGRRLLSTDLSQQLHALNKDNVIDVCGVCWGEFDKNNPPRAIPACRHFFHYNCIKEHSQSSNQCPDCGATF